MVLKQGGMFVVAYEAKFHALSKYATQLINTGEERIQLFIGGFDSELQVISSHMASMVKSYNDITDYVKKLEGLR